MRPPSASFPEQIFRLIPSASDSKSPSRQLRLRRCLSLLTTEPLSPSVQSDFTDTFSNLIREFAQEFFQPSVTSALLNPTTCLAKLRQLLLSPERDYLKILSDFVAISVIFVYNNRATSKLASTFLEDAALEDFPFTADEMDVIMRAFVRNPPNNTKTRSDKDHLLSCANVIAGFCNRSAVCAKIYREFLAPDRHSSSQRAILVEVGKCVLEIQPQHFTADDFSRIREFTSSKGVKSQPTARKGKIEMTPTRVKLEEEVQQKKIDGFFARFQGGTVLSFVVMTVIVAIGALLYQYVK
jgi:hypothetical protein